MAHILLISLALTVYGLFTIFVSSGWWRAVNRSKKTIPRPITDSASVIIPFRNELSRITPLVLSIKNIANRFQHVEFLFIDDHSDDHTADHLRIEFEDFPQITIISLPPNISGKKSAIQQGISLSKNDIIITIDADCELTEFAFSAAIESLSTSSTQMICGPVIQYSGEGFAGKLADVEFLSLIGSGISFWGNGFPFMANGAFLGFNKSAFQTVRGYEGNEHFPGGDDVFLLQKMVGHFGKNSIKFLTNHTDLIQTKGDVSLSEFIERRIRWGAKSKAYQTFSAKLLTLYVLFANVLLICGFSLLVINCEWKMLLYALLTKILCDTIILLPMIVRFKKWALLPFIFPAALLHPMYILFTGLLALFSQYTWKKRNYGR